MQVKQCRGPCKKILDVKHFYSNVLNKDRLQGKCKKCQSDYYKTYYAKFSMGERNMKKEIFSCNGDDAIYC